MHDIECGPARARAGNYVAGRLIEIDLRLDGGRRLCEVPTHVSHYGALALEQRRRALTALRTRGQRLNHMTGREKLNAGTSGDDRCEDYPAKPVVGFEDC